MTSRNNNCLSELIEKIWKKMKTILWIIHHSFKEKFIAIVLFPDVVILSCYSWKDHIYWIRQILIKIIDWGGEGSHSEISSCWNYGVSLLLKIFLRSHKTSYSIRSAICKHFSRVLGQKLHRTGLHEHIRDIFSLFLFADRMNRCLWLMRIQWPTATGAKYFFLFNVSLRCLPP